MVYSLIVVDDEDVSREGLSKLIDWASLGFYVAGSFRDGSDAEKYLEEHHIDVVLTDIKMSSVSGIDLAATVNQRYPATKVVLISGHARFDYAQEAIRHQVYHYLLKPFPLKEIDELFTRIRSELDDSSHKGSDARVGNGPVNLGSPADRVKQYVRDQVGKQVNLDEIAAHVDLAPGYVSRLFKEKTGETISHYIAKIRMERAGELLLGRSMRVYEVCSAVGYSDLKHFYAVFKKHMGCTPNEYRKRMRGVS